MSSGAEAPPVLRTFGYHCRQKFGQAVGKIPLDLGLPCPNRLRGGCIYCRAEGFAPSYLRSSDAVSLQVAEGKAHLLRGRFTKYYAYLQQETSTAMPAGELLPILAGLLADTDCVGLIISTRPDFIAEALLRPLADLVTASSKDCLFELGLQSVHDRSLRLLNRHHSFADFTSAAERILAAGCFSLGAHLIFGIPGESREDMLTSLKTVCAMGITALKLHHLQVLRGTALAAWYAEGRVNLFTQEEYLNFLLSALPHVPSNVTIHRLWATAHPGLLLAPRWNCLAGTLSALLRKKMTELGACQGQLAPANGHT
jgi:uncharacterized protein